ncbi:MAG TPA: trehalase family glycosidase [Pyrinomonadaceae bacterium]|nr:trehalase family glycosidase [Pyrinomonadaceae bacterium]
MTEKPKLRKPLISFLLILLLSSSPLTFVAAPADRASVEQLQAIQKYIKQSWHLLTRSNAALAKAAPDPKFKRMVGERWPVYVSRQEDIKRIEQSLRGQMPAADFERIELRQLPTNATEIKDHGLLYLPYPYVVPGGRFNEMYGWDSYFTQVGLVRDGEMVLAKNMTDNFLYQIEHYGKILNASRTYYLSRSQPPFLTQMVLNVYRKRHDIGWLRNTVPAIEKYYRFWTEDPHLTKETGLSRYYDLGEGPAPEVLSGERDPQGRDHYDLVKEYYHTHDVKDYDLNIYYDKAKDQLTDLFYKGDRSMRESGFDPSNRFGPFSIDIINYDPVCLNSLLYLMEMETAEILRIVGRARESRVWTNRAAARRESMNRLMWDDKDGLYYDYNFAEKKLRRYPFVTTFYPLWVGVADKSQAARIVANLQLFERPGGLLTSTSVSGSQWDAPFGWAPTEMIAIQGLRRYGYNKEADRLTANFLSTILKEFIQHNTIVEKYDVERRESEVSAGLKFGYKSNEIGFGWTNAAFTELYAQLPTRVKQNVLSLEGLPLPREKARLRSANDAQETNPAAARSKDGKKVSSWPKTP